METTQHNHVLAGDNVRLRSLTVSLRIHRVRNGPAVELPHVKLYKSWPGMKWRVFSQKILAERSHAGFTQMVWKHINESDQVYQEPLKPTSFVLPSEQMLSLQVVPEQNAPVCEILQHGAS